jgi:hypothetical protein
MESGGEEIGEFLAEPVAEFPLASVAVLSGAAGELAA